MRAFGPAPGRRLASFVRPHTPMRTSSMPPSSITMPTRQAGSARKFFIWLGVAASFFVVFAIRLYRDGASDIGFIVAMSIGAVLVIAFLSPKRFTSMRGATTEWEDDEPYGPVARHSESDANVGQPADSMANQKSKSDAA